MPDGRGSPGQHAGPRARGERAARGGDSQIDVAVCHLASEGPAQALAEVLTTRLATQLSGRAVGVAEVPSVLGAHVGPGLVGVTVAPRED